MKQQKERKPTILNTNIKTLRAIFGWTQQNMAQRISISVSNIKSYENSPVQPKLKTMLRISELSGISINDLSSRIVSVSEISKFVDANKSIPNNIGTPSDIAYIERDMSRYPDSVNGDYHFYYDVVRPIIRHRVKPVYQIPETPLRFDGNSVRKKASPKATSKAKSSAPIYFGDGKEIISTDRATLEGVAQNLSPILVEKWNNKNKNEAHEWAEKHFPGTNGQ